MGRGRWSWTEERIERLFKEGRGRGLGSKYQPFIQAADFSSSGLTRRITSPKTNRVHHLFSNVEYGFFLMLEWSRNVTDIREQFPLDRDITRSVAQELKIRHPTYPGTRVHTVITVDFLVTRLHEGQTILEAYDTKCANDLENPRVIEKLELARSTCEQLEIPHVVVTDRALPNQKIRNIEWIRGADHITEKEDPNGLLQEYCTRLLFSIAHAKNQTLSLSKHCTDFDVQCGLKPGMALRFARILLQKKAISANLEVPDLAAAPLSCYRVNAEPGKLRAVGGI